jgi:hypothetical protein
MTIAVSVEKLNTIHLIAAFLVRFASHEYALTFRRVI